MTPTSLARPPALRLGDRVAVLSISSPVDTAQLELGLATLRFAGLEPVVYPSARAGGTLREFLAGDDATRAGDLVDALTDDTIAGVFFGRGGVGAQRTLEAVDWSRLAGRPPKMLAGFSDVTAVLEAVGATLGWAGVHASMITSTETASHYSLASLLRLVMTPESAMTMTFPSAVTVNGGVAHGVTRGGNLCLLAASLGTPTSLPARDAILLLEDVHEEDFRVDRMLTQLRRSGYLDGVAGIVCGTWTDCGEPDVLEQILRERLGTLGVPMIIGADLGHGGPNQAFPIGIAATLDADTHTITFDDPPLVP